MSPHRLGLGRNAMVGDSRTHDIIVSRMQALFLSVTRAFATLPKRLFGQ